MPEGPGGPGDTAGHTTDPEETLRRLEELRERIVELDDQLIRLVGRRRELVLEIGGLKAALERPVMDPAREAAVVRRAAERSRELGVDEELTRDVIWRIIASAREAQAGERGWGPDPPPRPAGPSPRDGSEDAPGAPSGDDAGG